ncbi:MAG: hypothetical protein AAGJ28_00580 [Pseudomonadota bacterium]
MVSGWRQRSGRAGGFSLLTVLFGLSVVAVLITASLHRMASHHKVTGYQLRAHAEDAVWAGALQVGGELALASLLEGAPPLEGARVVRVDTASVEIAIRDAGGLVDVNTAAPDLLQRLFEGNAAQANLQQAIAGRQLEQRFHSVADFLRAIDLDPEDAGGVHAFLTVHSGRVGIHAEAAPAALLERLIGVKASPANPATALPAPWRSAPTRRVFAVELQRAGQGARRGFVAVTGGTAPRVRVLATDG